MFREELIAMTDPSAVSAAAVRPDYARVFLTFARNSLVRDMTFRTNFIIECISSLAWMGMNLAFYALVYKYTHAIGAQRRFNQRNGIRIFPLHQTRSHHLRDLTVKACKRLRQLAANRSSS